jgi:hypothetical protein
MENSLLALGVKVNALNNARDLIKANVVEAFKTGPADCPHSVIRHQKVLLPAHEKMLLVHPVFCYQIWS